MVHFTMKGEVLLPAAYVSHYFFVHASRIITIEAYLASDLDHLFRQGWFIIQQPLA